MVRKLNKKCLSLNCILPQLLHIFDPVITSNKQIYQALCKSAFGLKEKTNGQCGEVAECFAKKIAKPRSAIEHLCEFALFVRLLSRVEQLWEQVRSYHAALRLATR